MGPSPLNQDSLRGEEVGDKMWKLFDEAVGIHSSFQYKAWILPEIDRERRFVDRRNQKINNFIIRSNKRGLEGERIEPIPNVMEATSE